MKVLGLAQNLQRQVLLFLTTGTVKRRQPSTVALSRHVECDKRFYPRFAVLSFDRSRTLHKIMTQIGSGCNAWR
jgi:hypothetical protein